jgi:hypothetical protein
MLDTRSRSFDLVPVLIKKREIEPHREHLKGYLWCEKCEMITVHAFEGNPRSVRKSDDYMCIVCDTKRLVYNTSDSPDLREDDKRFMERRRKALDLPDVHERKKTRDNFVED